MNIGSFAEQYKHSSKLCDTDSYKHFVSDMALKSMCTESQWIEFWESYSIWTLIIFPDVGFEKKEGNAANEVFVS